MDATASQPTPPPWLFTGNELTGPPRAHPHDAEIRAAQVQTVAEAAADPAAVDVMPGQAFVAHHSMPPAKGAEFMRTTLETGRTPAR